jgi:hypothetical protein
MCGKARFPDARLPADKDQPGLPPRGGMQRRLKLSPFRDSADED